MARVVISVQPDTDNNEYLSLESGDSRATQLARLNCDPSASPFAELANGDLLPARTREAGEALAVALRKHPAIAAAMSTAAGLPGTLTPLYVHIQSERAENLPWEALYDAQAFFALDRLRPIGRLTASRRSVPRRRLAEPVMMVAVLSAIGVDATPEWMSLKTAVERATANGIRVEMRIMVGEPALLATIQAAAVPGVTVELLQDRDTLIGAIVDAQPNILHFFCHGSAEYGSYLSIATNADHVAGINGSILIEPRDFDPPDIRKSLWLATLNACDTAAGGSQTRSLGRALVDVGIPVVIAMRERIAPKVAHAVAEKMYDSLFSAIRDHLRAAPNGGAEEIIIEWAGVLTDARSHLSNVYAPQGVPGGQAAQLTKEWTLPVLYLRDPEFRLVRSVSNLNRAQEQEYLAELSVLKAGLAGLHPSTPASVRQPIAARIAELETLLTDR